MHMLSYRVTVKCKHIYKKVDRYYIGCRKEKKRIVTNFRTSNLLIIKPLDCENLNMILHNLLEIERKQKHKVFIYVI